MPPAIVPSVEHEFSPAIATDGRDYLAVWTGPGVRAARISRSGELIDHDSFAIARVGASAVRVVWTGSSYLVVYGNLYARVSSDGEVLKADQKLPIPSQYLTDMAWNGHALLVACLEPQGRTSIPVLSLLDANLEPIRARIELSAAVVPSADGFVALSSAPSGLVSRFISNDGTISDPTPVVTIDVKSAAIGSDGQNVIVAWSSSAAVHAMNLSTRTVHDISNTAATDLNVTGGPNGFVIAWANNGLFAKRAGTDGQAIDTSAVRLSDFIYSNGIRGASNGDSFLLLWSDGRRTPFYIADTVWGTSIPATRPELAHEFPIALSPANQFAPAAAVNSGVALVAWSETAVDEESRIVTARLSSEGNLLDPNGIALAAEGIYPAVTTDGRDFLVAWRDAAKPHDRVRLVRAALVRADGTMGPVQILSNEDGMSAPSVTFDGRDYFVVWDDGAATEITHVRGARVDRDGHLVDSVPFDYGLGLTPAIAFDGTSHWIVYVHEGVVARRITREGFFDGSSRLLDPSPASPPFPTIACSGSVCLAAWDHFSPTDNSDLYGAIVTSKGPPFTIATNQQQMAPKIAADGPGFFITWPEWSGSEFDMRGGRISATGEVLGIFTVANDPAAIPLTLANMRAVILAHGWRLFLRVPLQESRRQAAHH